MNNIIFQDEVKSVILLNDFDKCITIEILCKMRDYNIIYYELDTYNPNINKLQDNFKEIHFNKNFNDKILKLPKGIKKIFFGNKFNKIVDFIHEGVIEVHFGFEFNSNIFNLP